LDGPVPYSWPVPTKASRELGLLDAALWAASFALCVLSIAFSWGAPPHLGPQFDWSDKAWHFLGYGALCGTLLLAAVWRPGRGGGRFPQAAAGVTLLVLALAWATEALQAPFGRDADPTDGLADLAGIALAFVAWRGLRGPGRQGGITVLGLEPLPRARLHMAGLTAAAWLVDGLTRGRGMRRATILVGRAFGSRDSSVFSMPGDRRVKISLSDPYWIPPLLLRGTYEPEVAELLSAVMTRESFFIDCGANIGWWSIFAGTIIPVPERILAVEPSSSLFAQLVENARLNQDAFTCIQAAVWETAGTPLTLQVEKHHAGRSSIESGSALWSQGYDHTETITSITLDELIERCAGGPSGSIVVKLDVEGAELQALAGAHRHMGSLNIVVYEDHGKDPRPTVTLAMVEKGFDIFHCDDSMRIHRVVDPKDVAAIKRDTRRGYNFAASRAGSHAWTRLQERSSP
jgi:FkbM family methyltransferase